MPDLRQEDEEQVLPDQPHQVRPPEEEQIQV